MKLAVHAESDEQCINTSVKFGIGKYAMEINGHHRLFCNFKLCMLSYRTEYPPSHPQHFFYWSPSSILLRLFFLHKGKSKWHETVCSINSGRTAGNVKKKAMVLRTDNCTEIDACKYYKTSTWSTEVKLVIIKKSTK